MTNYQRKPRHLLLAIPFGLAILAGPQFFAATSTAYAYTDADAATEGHTRRGFSTVEADFLRKLHLINQAEIKVGKLAERRATAEAAKDYGRILTKDHIKADTEVAAVAKANQVQLRTDGNEGAVIDLRDKLNSMYQQLTETKDGSFDQAFAEDMVAGHTDAIKMVEMAEQDFANNPAIISLSKSLLPHLHHHLDEANALQKKNLAH